MSPSLFAKDIDLVHNIYITRSYEDSGILPVPARIANGYRSYMADFEVCLVGRG